MHNTPAQNRAHRADPIWIKVGPSEYMRSDGVTIRKDRTRSCDLWTVYLPTGQAAQNPRHPSLRAAGHSLTVAKLEAADVATDTAPHFYLNEQVTASQPGCPEFAGRFAGLDGGWALVEHPGLHGATLTARVHPSRVFITGGRA